MEGRSGFKECPRCGLRNRISAHKCDFCGYGFQQSTEEWSDYVDMLENLSKGEESRPVDEEISKRFEATLIRKDELEDSDAGPAPIAGTLIDLDTDRSGEEAIESEEGGSEEVAVFVDSMIDEGIPSEMDSSEHHKGESEDIILFEEDAPSTPEPEIEVREEGEGEVLGAAVTAAIASGEEYRTGLPSHHPEGLPGAEDDAEAAVKQDESSLPEETLESSAPPLEGGISEGEEPDDQASVQVEDDVGAESDTGPSLPFRASLGVGVLLYLTAIGGYLFFSFDTSLSWIVAVAGTLLALLGIGGLYETIIPVSQGRRSRWDG